LEKGFREPKESTDLGDKDVFEQTIAWVRARVSE